MPESAQKPLYHLGDGIVLGIGSRDTQLIDLKTDGEIRIDFRFIEPLEKVSLGWSGEGYESFLPRLLQEGVIVHGPATTDPVLKTKLAALDRLYLTAYEAALSPRARRAYELTLEAHGRRKRFFTRVGQCPTLPETTLRRALLVGDAAEVGAKKILCVGDDDLVSVPLAALGHDVTVFDIDDFLLTFLRDTAAALGLTLQAVEKDLRDPLDDAERDHFDLFLTDPMSNRDCFEIFLSRAFSLVKPGARGYVAVYGPTERLFREVAAEMKFPIVAWHRRHNRYYSQYMKIHTYESDWVEIRRDAGTVVKHAANEFCVPLNLYAEQFYQRHPIFFGFYDEIEEPRFATPLYLDMILDIAEGNSPLKLTARHTILGQEWTVIHGSTDDGHLTVHVDRARRQLTMTLFPMRAESEDVLRHAFMSGYKPKATQAKMSSSRDVWDLRIR
ncbi:MAG: bis-aminopropyl spermidine synthase family protein [Deltaproteobacteria bacterium]|nr:bis-aminopropyl spermidine synthase family protein [Deltaproteobacteria bacterium]